MYVTLEGLSEDRVELLDVVLQSNDVTIKRKHVVNAFVLEALNVDSLILCQLDQISDLVVFRNVDLFLVVETQVKGVDANWIIVLWILILVVVYIEHNHINLSQSISSLQRHQVVERL